MARWARAGQRAPPHEHKRLRQALAAEELVDVVDCPGAWIPDCRMLTHFRLAA